MTDPLPASSSDAVKARRVRPLHVRLAILFVALALGIPGGFLAARMISRPLVDTLHTYKPDIITRLHDRNGDVFAEYAIQRRIVVPMSAISPNFFNAVVAIEDARFLSHGGIDPKAVVRAAVKDLIARKKVEGASTLTQQLAKQLFLTPQKSWRRKINEMFLAVEIEKNFTKDQIFEMYANQAYLGHGAYGVESAARLYFGKHAKDLSVPEAALIAGLIRSPATYSPINHPDRALKRRNLVLRRMLDEKYLDRAEYDRAVKTPVVLGSYKEETPGVGGYFSEEVRKYLEKNYGTEELYRNGLEVETTLDVRVQRIAEDALQAGLRRWDKRRGFRKPTRNLVAEGIDPAEYEDPAWEGEIVPEKIYPAVVMAKSRQQVEVRLGSKTIDLERPAWAWTKKANLPELLERGDIVHVRLAADDKDGKKGGWELDQLPLVQGAVVVLDVKTGEILALSGGYDFATSKFNRAVQSLRQTGSSFKPFVYAAAFEAGLTPADTFFDAPLEITMDSGQIYAPRDFYEDKYEGIITIERALEASLNIPAVKASEMIGREKVIDFARRCGITSQLDPYPSIALGAAGVSPLELAAAYNALANQGVYVRPRYIRRILSSTQRVIEQDYPDLSETTSAQVAYLTTHLLEGVILRGTGYAAHVLPGVHAGKTGTTNGYTDAWFVGFSPLHTVAVWVGYDDPQKSLGYHATGAEVALPIWMDVFQKLGDEKIGGEPSQAFDVPPGIVEVPIDLKTGRLGRGPCGKVVVAAFIAGTEPTQDCSGELGTTASLEPGSAEEIPVEGTGENPGETHDDAPTGR